MFDSLRQTFGLRTSQPLPSARPRAKLLIESVDGKPPKYLEMSRTLHPDEVYRIDGLSVHVNRQVGELTPIATATEATQAFGIVPGELAFQISSTAARRDLLKVLAGAGRDLLLHRAFANSHFCWDALRNDGQLVSEGPVDNPTFTMGNGNRGTCWLPFSTSTAEELAALAAGGIDNHTRSLSAKHPVPVGVVVSYLFNEVQAARADRGVCWLNDVEISVRGPLTAGEFAFAGVVWLDSLIPEFTRWPPMPVHVRLPPARPYGAAATEASVTAWWQATQPWLQAAADAGDVMAMKATGRLPRAT
ncbi:hypothetical protein L2Y94_02840 [Luteibacter aegosomatis]|uniref:hypothetical protein n=1 Tax=Luteibacter aegosomatis TaxID=2911537 RepID=UPI001FFA5519|nr:hypothetical protein [Luteibacter aegosomatis]UPG86321.1 hypothetical protein L2Y94_02840 [Luteibacter aegosomatis]